MEVAVRSSLAVVDLDSWPSPEGGWGAALTLRAVVAAGALLAIVLTSWSSAPAPLSPDRRKRLLALCLLWVLVGFLPPLLPSVGWHAYYAVIGLLGAWVGLGLLLCDRRRLAILSVVVMAFLRAGRSSTPSWDWGTEWYQVRAGNMLRVFRAQLQQRHPAFPRHARVYFTHVPNNIGLIAGRSSALRIWYDDSMLETRFRRDFAMRAPNEAAGPDFFFHFDTLWGLVEIELSRDGNTRPQSADWERRYFNLATAFLLGGDVEQAASEYLAIARANPRRTDCSMYAAACYDVLNHPEARDEALALASAAGMSAEDVGRELRRLVASFPRRP